MDVMFYEVFKEEEAALKGIIPEGIQAGYSAKTIQENKDKRAPADVISIRTQSNIPLEWANSLRGILSRSQGYDHLLEYQQSCGISVPCGYLVNYCSRAVAEHALLAMLALLKNLKRQIKHFDRFDRDDLTNIECRGKRALVVGVGNIGSEIVQMVKGLGMEVKGVDIDPKLKGIDYCSLQEGVSWAKVVFCALPLTDKTEHMFDYKLLKTCSPGLIFVNISRGEISPIQDLKRLLDENILGGVALDVYQEEDLLAGHLRNWLAINC